MFGIVTDDNEEQYLKALSPILVTPLPISIFFIALLYALSGELEELLPFHKILDKEVDEDCNTKLPVVTVMAIT